MKVNHLAPGYAIWISTHLKLCVADATHSFKWVKIISINFVKIGGWSFLKLADLRRLRCQSVHANDRNYFSGDLKLKG